MIISIYGAGYVGLVSAACLAKIGHEVICADIDKAKITSLLNGVCPIYEKDLPELLLHELNDKRLHFTSDLDTAIKKADIHIIATGTPSDSEGNADLSQVFSVARRIAAGIEKNTVLVTKSTVPVGTGDILQALVNEELALHSKNYSIQLASNPEFLREGTAVFDFLQADRIIIGGETEALNILEELYRPLTEQGIPLIRMSLHSAELTKYAANAMLAARISFMNQISQIAEHFDANIDEIKRGMALDPRIGPLFLNAGIGYGGSCFPKDVSALIHTAKKAHLDASLLEATDSINRQQKNWVLQKLIHHFEGQLQGLTLGIWGLAFKPGTDDLREASSLVAIQQLLDRGAKLRVFDPVAMANTQKLYGAHVDVHFCTSLEDLFNETVDGLIIMTEWPEFKEYSLASLKLHLNKAPLFDGRNCFDLVDIKKAQLAYYYSVGRPIIVS